MVCSCPLGALALGPLWLCRSRSVTAYVLSGVTQHKLRSRLQMDAACAGLGDIHVRPSCEPRPDVVSAMPGATKQESMGLA